MWFRGSHHWWAAISEVKRYQEGVIAGYCTSQVNSTPLPPLTPPPPPHIIMRNVGSRLLGNVALGQAPQWDGRGKRRKKEARGSQKTFPPLQSTAQLALLPALCSLHFEREGNLDMRPALPRARLAPLTRPKSPFRFFRAPATQANFPAVSPLFCLLLWSLVTGC